MLGRIRMGFVPKVFAIAIAGVLLVIGVLSWTTLSYIQRDIDENARKQLDLAINLELALIQQHLDQVKAVAVTVAENPKLAGDLLSGDYAEIAQDLRRVQQATSHVHVLTLVDPAGRVLARANSDQVGQPLGINGLVSLALRGTAVASPEIIPQPEWEPEGEAVASISEANTAATEEMAASSQQMSQAIARIASVARANAVAAQELSTFVEDMNARTHELTASAQALARIARELQEQTGRFKL